MCRPFLAAQLREEGLEDVQGSLRVDGVQWGVWTVGARALVVFVRRLCVRELLRMAKE